MVSFLFSSISDWNSAQQQCALSLPPDNDCHTWSRWFFFSDQLPVPTRNRSLLFPDWPFLLDRRVWNYVGDTGINSLFWLVYHVTKGPLTDWWFIVAHTYELPFRATYNMYPELLDETETIVTTNFYTMDIVLEWLSNSYTHISFFWPVVPY